MTAAKGKAADAAADNDTSYAEALQKHRGDAGKQAIEAAERSVAKARETLKAQEAELAKAKKENS
jgi:hypothetical protein